MPFPDAVFDASTSKPLPDGRIARHADVVFRAGKYSFPEDQGGDFEMTPDDIRKFCAEFKGPVQLEDTHAPSYFSDKLGELLSVNPSADFTSFGGDVALNKWVHDLHEGQPMCLSPRFRRSDKSLIRVALTPTPRISDAVLFAAFAAAYPPAAADPAVTPAPAAAPAAAPAVSPAGEKAAHGITAMIAAALQDTSLPESERKTLAKMAEMCSAMCESPPELPPANDSPPAKKPSQTTSEAAMSDAEKALSEKNRKLEAAFALQQQEIKALQARDGKREEALFEEKKKSWRAEGKEFLRSIAGKITTAEAPGLLEAYFEAAMDDHQHPREVCFSAADGKTVKGSRLAAFKQGQCNRPDHGLFTELAGDGSGGKAGDALFNQTATDTGKEKPLTPAERDSWLAKSDTGREILRERRTNGSR